MAHKLFIPVAFTPNVAHFCLFFVRRYNPFIALLAPLPMRSSNGGEGTEQVMPPTTEKHPKFYTNTVPNLPKTPAYNVHGLILYSCNSAIKIRPGRFLNTINHSMQMNCRKKWWEVWKKTELCKYCDSSPLCNLYFILVIIHLCPSDSTRSAAHCSGSTRRGGPNHTGQWGKCTHMWNKEENREIHHSLSWVILYWSILFLGQTTHLPTFLCDVIIMLWY